jgi:maltooligosyltrehalose trehalohydrolase
MTDREPSYTQFGVQTGSAGVSDAKKAGVRRVHMMPCGAEFTPDQTRFRIWAPGKSRVLLDVTGRTMQPMVSMPCGWHELTVPGILAGDRYGFRLDEGLLVPDPASRFQPDDVHGRSEVIDPSSYQWGDTSWRGRPWADAVIYELHIGTFTPEGTFRGAIDRLDHLAALGVTALELMPIADFPGERNWGYDGVQLYAPDSRYGRPDELKALVDAAHANHIMMFLDVVYNHFGPDGNYIPVYAPPIFTDRHQTPWGAAVNYDGKESGAVRELVIHNALYWLEEFHFDGLRLDAVHAIIDDSPTHLLQELSERVRAEFGTRREIHLILENEENQVHWLKRQDAVQPSAYTAQWNDDIHHGLHTAATGEMSGYYEEYKGDTAKLARAIAEGFAFQGEVMGYSGKRRGEPSGDLPSQAFVSFIQNHDQVGNRAFGDRITAAVSDERVRAIAAIFLLSPQIPMLFMGQEWATTSPFPFFCDFQDPMAESVRNGRRNEFAKFPEFRDEKVRARIPDPTAETTFLSAKLNWNELNFGKHAAWLNWHRDILRVRSRKIRPLLESILRAGSYAVGHEGAFRVTWDAAERGRLQLIANLSDQSWRTEQPAAGADIIWVEGTVAEDEWGPWAVTWLFEDEE